MSDRFEINIARDREHWRNGAWVMIPLHYCKVTLPIGTMFTDAAAYLGEFKARFPDEEGWKVTVTEWVERGHDQTADLLSSLQVK